MALSIVASAIAQGTTGGATTGGIDTSGSNLLVYGENYFTSAALTRTDSKGNTTISAIEHDNTTTKIGIRYVTNSPVVGSAHTYGVSAATSFPAVYMAGLSGAHATAPLDQINSNSTGSSVGSITTNPVTPVEGNEFVMSAFGDAWDNIDTISVGSIDKQLGFVGGTSFALGIGVEIQGGSPSTSNPSAAWSPNTVGANACIATFKSAGGAAAVLYPPWRHFDTTETIGVGAL